MQAASILSKLHAQEVSIYTFVLTSTSEVKSLLDIDNDKAQKACLFTHDHLILVRSQPPFNPVTYKVYL